MLWRLRPRCRTSRRHLRRHLPTMAAYRQEVDKLGGHFTGYSVEWIDRRKNEEADALSRIGSARLAPPAGVFLDTISKPSVSPRGRSTSEFRYNQTQPWSQ